MSNIFSIHEENINSISSEDCVRLFGELLYSDARRLKLSISKVNFTTKTTVPDGGIDASIEDGLSQEEGDLIIDSESFYQIKSGETFSPWQESEIKKELLHGKDSIKDNLGDEVQRCFQRNGTYILVCMKVQLSTKQKTQSEEHLTNILKTCGIDNPKIKVWGQDKIIGTIASYPSISLRLTRRNNIPFESHDSWSRNDDMKKELVLGEKQNDFIQKIQGFLDDCSETVHVNVCGEPGIGKTRLVLESTRIPSLAPLVIYCSSPEEFLSNSLLREIKTDCKLCCILIIDECDQRDRIKIWNQLESIGPRVKFVTISNEYKKTSGIGEQMEAPHLDDSQIKEIIKIYHNDNIIDGRLSKICNGIPRLAHMVGWDLKNNPTEILRASQDTFGFFDRYINQGEIHTSTFVQERKAILLTISLFKKVGNAKHFPDEFDAVWSIVHEICPSISKPNFKVHVKNLQERKILQGRETLYISPKALHLWLWMKWWEDYHDSFKLEDLIKKFPLKLEEWFFIMFEYVANSDAAKAVIQELFNVGGQFTNPESIKTNLGAYFFRLLSKADPAAAIDYLESAMNTWSDEELRDFPIQYRNIINGLERIIFEPELFDRGGVLLRNLAEHEERPNHATELFAELFSLGTDHISLTQTPPKTRLALLKETLCSDNKDRRNLGLEACKSALEFKPFSPLGFDSDELGSTQKGWEPKTNQELVDAYKSIIDLMIEKIQTFPDKDKQKCASIISDNSGELLRTLPSMTDFVVEKLFVIHDFIDKETILQNIADILEFEKERLSPEIRTKFKELQAKIIGTDHSSLLRRYVGMDIMSDFGKKDYEKERIEHIQKLVEVYSDSEKLKSELSWLVTENAKHGYEFGQELAKKDDSFSLLSLLLDEQRKTHEKDNGFFLGGYLQIIFEKDYEHYFKIIKDISQDPKLIKFLVEIAWRSGVTDEIGLFILNLVKSKKINVDELGKSVLIHVVSRLSESVVILYIEYMIDTDEQRIIFDALSLFELFFVHNPKKTLNPDIVLNPDITLKLLTHDVLIGKKSVHVCDTTIDYHWNSIGLKFIHQFPNRSLELVDKILASMDSSVSPLISFGSRYIRVLDEIASKLPNEIWDLMIKYISLPFDERSYAIANLMRYRLSASPDSFLDKVDFQKISAWIDRDPHKLAPYIVSHIQPILSSTSLARKLLAKYGSEKSVRRSLFINFLSGSSIGPRSIYFQNKKDQLVDYLKQDDDVNVKNWINFCLKSLDEDINREKLQEEREF